MTPMPILFALPSNPIAIMVAVVVFECDVWRVKVGRRGVTESVAEPRAYR
jgi:hypothetical protein